ncbi:MAG: ankyrin repeat domain-containing protein [Candidatus Rifleibacteriota bacterium]
MNFVRNRLESVLIIAVSLLFLLLNCKISAANKFNSERFKCPLCNIDFSVFAETKSDTDSAMAIDGQPLSFKPAPLPQCPLCGGVFTRKNYTEKEINELKRIVWSKAYQKTGSESSLWKSAIIKERMFYSDYDLFVAWHKAALQENSGSNKHKLALDKAAFHLKNWLILQNEAASKETAKNYLKLADILRQAENFNEAQKQLEKVKNININELQPVIRKEQQLIKDKNTRRVAAPDGNRLHQAIAAGNREEVKSLLKNRELLSESDLQGNTPLLLAVKLKKPQIVSLLLKNGASTGSTDIELHSPLHEATQNNDLTMLNTLLKANPVINSKNRSGQTAIHVAAKNCYPEAFSLLLRHNADINLTDSAGNSVLHLVCTGTETARVSICKKILELNPQINSRNFSDYTPLHIAAINGSKELITTLVRAGADIDSRLPNGNTALFFCKTDLIPHFLTLGANPELKNNQGLTPFDYALLNGIKKRIHAFRKVLQKQNKISSTASASLKSLHKAIRNGKIDLVNKLVGQNPEIVNYKDIKLGETALHIAAEANQTAIAKFLLKNNAKINCYNHFARTPLHYTAMQGNLNLVKTLIEAGANLFAVDLRGSTPLHDAATSGDIETYQYLIRAGAVDSTKNNAGRSPKDIFNENKEEN